MAPGSMPAGSRELLQEGIVIPPVRIARDGGRWMTSWRSCWPTPARRTSARAICAPSSPRTAWPSGACRRWRPATAPRRVRSAFGALFDYAERRTRAAIAAMPDGRYEAAEALEGDGVAEGELWIRVAVTIAR